MSTKYLAHITTKENCDKIVASNHFNISIHSKKTNQWLGDGIYFWDANDEKALKLGYRMVRNKPGNHLKKIKKISFLVDIDDSKHVDLDSEVWNEKFERFLKKICSSGEELLKMLEMLKSQPKVSNRDLNLMGKIFGNSVNLFVTVLSKKDNIDIDVVSHYFYHMTKKNLLSSREELCYRQFCIKNADLVNSINKSNWYIEDIVR